jgi:hypothetical protein
MKILIIAIILIGLASALFLPISTESRTTSITKDSLHLQFTFVNHRTLFLPSVVDFYFNLTNVGTSKYQTLAGFEPFAAYLYDKNSNFIQPIFNPGIILTYTKLLSLKPGESIDFSFSLAVTGYNSTFIHVYSEQYQLSGAFTPIDPKVPVVETPKVIIDLR